jgi:hypothetical protein
MKLSTFSGITCQLSPEFAPDSVFPHRDRYAKDLSAFKWPNTNKAKI